MEAFRTFAWHPSRAGEALDALARAGGLAPRAADLPPVPEGACREAEALGSWLDEAAEYLDLELEPVQALYNEALPLLRGAGPALITLDDEGQLKLLVLAKARGRKAVLLAPDLHFHTVPLEELRQQVCRSLESSLKVQVEQLLRAARVAPRRQAAVKATIFREQLRSRRLPLCWLVRTAPGTSFRMQAERAGLLQQATLLLVTHGLQYGVWLLSWWVIGWGALNGRLSPGWMVAWLLLLLTLIPLRALSLHAVGRLAIGLGGLLKQRLLAGALALRPDEVRHQGVGQFIGKVIESEAVESLAMNGGIQGMVATLELVGAALLFHVGADSPMHTGLLVAALACCALLYRHFLTHREGWTHLRLGLTNSLIERLVGNRTRVIQEPATRRHDEEDAALQRTQAAAEPMDRAAVWLTQALPRLWLLAGLASLSPGFLAGSLSSTTLAVTLGGVLLAYQSLQRLVASLFNLAGVAIAWKQIKPIFDAAARQDIRTIPGLSRRNPDPALAREPFLVEARKLTFSYRPGGRNVLRECDLAIRPGERILLEGASGGGKSTLGSLLAGLRPPESGLLLLGGLDHPTLGIRGWRRRVAASPQFHENHVFTGTFAFNLLMGSGWPASASAYASAEALCRELGLGPLLDRMPAGLMQMVGETGWQLSHGEKSRLYIARALLQGADLLILDESFAALDPETLIQVSTCVIDRAPTLLVIAHP